jgi:hypothetical protein
VIQRYFILAICQLICFFIILHGCVKNIPKEQIRENLIEVSNNIDIYGYEMEMEMETSIADEDSNTIVKSNSNGYVDIKNKKIKKSININETNKGKTKLTHTEIYIFDDTEYMQSGKDGNWIKFEVPRNKLDSENQLKKQMKLVMTSKIKSIKEEGFKNIDCYLLGIEPDKDSFWKVIMEQEEEHPLLKLLNLDYENVVKDMDMKLWISKDKFSPMKCIMEMKAVIEKEIMKAPFKMTMNVKKTYRYHDYIKLRAIELPEQAKKAKVYNEEEWD